MKITLYNNVYLNGKKLIIDSNTILNGNGHIIYCGEVLIKGNNNKIENVKIIYSPKCGLKIKGNKNKIENVSTINNKRTGIQICDGGSNNKIINCYSAYNNSGTGDADGFACKLNSGKGNVFKNCQAYYNEDDGFDLFAAGDSVKLINCKSCYNDRNNGSGFKLGGFKKEDDLNPNIHHELYNCIACGNARYGFTSNNQVGNITLEKCSSFFNRKEDYFFPKISHPKNKSELKLGKTFIKKCLKIPTSTSNTDGIEEAKWIKRFSLKEIIKSL